MQVVLCAAGGHGLAEFAVGGGFAEVQVGDEEDLLCWPPDGVVGQEVQGFVGPLHGGVGGFFSLHGWRG